MKKRYADGGMPGGMSKQQLQEVMVRGIPARMPNPKYGEAREPYYRKSDDTVVLPDNALFGVDRDSGVERQLEADEMGSDVASDITDRAPTPRRKGGPIKSSGSHMSNADHVKKHYAVGGFMHHSDHAKKLCGGGYMKGKK